MNKEKFREVFLHKAPLSAVDAVPGYYRQIFQGTYIVLGVQFLLCAILAVFSGIDLHFAITLAMLGVSVIMVWAHRRLQVRANLIIYAAVTVFWSMEFMRYYGWNYGGQHLILPLLIVIFFSVYETMLTKLICLVLLFALRMLMWIYTMKNVPVFDPVHSVGILLQLVNTLLLFIHVAYICAILSMNIQSAELKLMQYNQELKKQAGTDPLTGLMNRRSMFEQVDTFMKKHPTDMFNVAIADIDFFKKVNDTYGHDCGDYVLKELSALFRSKAQGSAQVCRWGGEEFFFFIPYCNLDDASFLMESVRAAVQGMPLEFNGQKLSITITAGVEDYDFRSALDQVIKTADNKLYTGKQSGRNRVVT